MDTKELEMKITGEEYFVHSYGDDEFYEFWNTYTKTHNIPSSMNNDNVQYDFNKVLFDFISQLNTFVEPKNFVIGFGTTLDEINDPKGLVYSVSYLIEQKFGVITDVTKKHKVRIFGEVDGDLEAPARLQITIVGTNQVYDFIVDAKGNTNIVEFDNNYIIACGEYLGNITVANELNTPVAIIDGNQLLGERHRAIVLYDGASYMREEQQISLALNGYNTGQFDKLIYKFSKYEVGQGAINEGVSTYITYNNASDEIYDGFYNTQCHMTGTNGQAFMNELITKAFNLNIDGTLTGYSANDYELTNKIVLRSVTAIIDEEYWNQNEYVEKEKLKNYATIQTIDLDPNVEEIYLKDAVTAYNIYDLNETELLTFKSLYKN